MNFKLLYPILYLMIYFFSAGNAMADSTDFLLELAKQSTKDYAFQDISIVEKPETIFIVAIGLTSYNPNSKRSVLQARKKSRLKALQSLTKFINGTYISSYEEINHNTQVLSDNRGVTSKKLSKKFYSNISSKSEGALNNVKDIGFWRNEKSNDYFCCLSILINNE